MKTNLTRGYCLVALLLLSNSAYAAFDASAIVAFFDSLVEALILIAAPIITIGLIIVGIRKLQGRAEWSDMMWWITGAVIIFGAKLIVEAVKAAMG